jgi:hypothetical protein
LSERILLALVVVVGALLATGTAQAQTSGDVAQCTTDVGIRWNGLELDLEDPDPARSDWFVRRLRTVSQGTGCSGLVQTLTLLDGDRSVLYRGSVTLDAQGNGDYRGVDARVEDVAEVQVVLGRDGPTSPGDDDDDDGSLASSLPRTGADAAVLALVGALFVAVGFAVRGRVEPR